jgi:molybdate transport system ATP-binding protein
LAGLDRHDASIRYRDDVWQSPNIFVPTHKRQIGLVFQGTGLLPHLSIRQNLEFAMRRAPAGPFAFEDVIVRTGIFDMLDRSPVRLSGGEAQRASIARALLGQPKLLLMDEPLSGLDGDARATLLDALESLLAEIAIPTLYVTHDEAEASRLAAQTIRINCGRVTISVP